MTNGDSGEQRLDHISLPEVAELWKVHPGLTEVVARNYAEARDVVMTGLHTSPTRFMVSDEHAPYNTMTLAWITATAQQLAAWANTDDATRDAAYGVAIAFVNVQYRLVAVIRAERVTGCDYFLAPRDQEMETLDVDDKIKLEISGSRTSRPSDLQERLKEKVTQLGALPPFNP